MFMGKPIKVDDDHPIWEVHDAHRTACLNAKYHTCVLQRLEKRDRWMEVLIAITTPSAVAGLWFWQTAVGAWLWGTIGAIAAVTAAVKPFLRYTERIRRLEEVVTLYTALEHDLYTIGVEAKHRSAYTEHLQTRFMEALADLKRIKEKQAERGEDKELKGTCENEVRRQWPDSRYFVPKD
jgi:DNA-binding PucR family transcriptional regulator